MNEHTFADYVEVNGVKVSGLVIPQAIAMVTNPDPKRWYRFWRDENNMIHVETKVDQ